jgi:peptidyl-prolyl cis-trans isomerase D
VGIKNGFAVPMLVEQKPPRIPEFDEVKERVRAALRAEKANGMLEQKAKEIAAAAKSPGDLKGLAEKSGFDAKAEANYKLSTPLGDSGSSVLIDDPLNNAKAGDVLQPIFLNSNYLVIGVNKKTDADLTEYAKQRESLMQQALSDRKNQVFEDYLASVSSQMKQAGKIKIYKEVLDTVAEDEPEAQPPRRPQLPITK